MLILTALMTAGVNVKKNLLKCSFKRRETEQSCKYILINSKDSKEIVGMTTLNVLSSSLGGFINKSVLSC